MGGAAIHFAPQSLRFSGDLDFLHDSVQRVATAFATDQALLSAAGFHVDVESRSMWLRQSAMAKRAVDR